jgi:hypothetical protein
MSDSLIDDSLSRGSIHVIRQTLEMCRDILEDEGYGAAVDKCQTAIALINCVHKKESRR